MKKIRDNQFMMAIKFSDNDYGITFKALMGILLDAYDSGCNDKDFSVDNIVKQINKAVHTICNIFQDGKYDGKYKRLEISSEDVFIGMDNVTDLLYDTSKTSLSNGDLVVGSIDFRGDKKVYLV